MKLFNTGLEQANLVLLSNVLQLLWAQISNLYSEIDESPSSSSSSSSLRNRISDEPKWTTITFSTPRGFAAEKLRGQGSDLVSSVDSEESFDLFKFLRGKTEFAVNRAVITLFHEHRDQLSLLKNQMIAMIKAQKDPKPIIITGHSLGGSIASLFTLWLLDGSDFSSKKRPICVTFGSPLIGDNNLQKALYKNSPWCSNFLHVASIQDPVPRMLANNGKDYTPFGTFLLCSESGCSCFEDPWTILALLAKTAPQSQVCNGMVDYGQVVEGLKRKALFDKTVDNNWFESPYQVGIVTQLSAIGLVSSSPLPEVRPEIERLTKEIEKEEMKFQIGKRTVKPDKKLNDSKVYMAKLEWYMKLSRDKGIGYYDSYKSMRFTRDINIQECVKRLIIYWTDLVEEADKKPQADGETLRTRWLFSGLNYMRLVEPLCIAEHYSHKGLSEYEAKGRLKHFARLEELVAEAKKKEAEENKKKKKKQYCISLEQKKKRIRTSLTDDSCFWAKVEEAAILCKAIKREEASDKEKRDCESKLKKFEEKVLVLLENYDVSPEIFFGQSSFMLWWKEYKEAMGSGYSSSLNDIMANHNYKRYSKGEL